MKGDTLKYRNIGLDGPSRKILLISRSFYPVKSPRSLRTTALAKEFARQGHKVTVLTLKNDEVHVPFEKEYGITIKDIGPLRFPEIDIPIPSGPWRYFKRGIRRGMQLLFEYPDIELVFKVNKALQKESGYDLIISIAVPHPIHWGVALARNNNHRIADVWVADCGDPFYGLESDSFNKLFYFAYVEKWCFHKADYISIPFEGAKSAYFQEFQHKIRVIPQGLSFPKKLSLADNSTNEHITFAYFGNIQSYLHYALPFLEKLNAIDRAFTFIVYTKKKKLFENTLNQKTLNKCQIREYVERYKLFEALSGVDFLVHFPYKKGSQKSLKLIDYNYLGKPILTYRNDAYSEKVLNEFLDFNFENKKDPEDHTEYEIENVGSQFLQLLQPNMHLRSPNSR